jgi:pimeloyl-ACP methyl ester carboxylesterase
VPLDYAHPNNGSFGIALIRKPAIDQANRLGSVLTNPGGPGASGITFLRVEAPAMKNVNQRFDLVGFDPRGVGQSSPVRCLDGPQEDAFNALDVVLDDPQEKQAAIQAAKAFDAGCEQLSAQILPYVDTVSAAKDMEVMRSALGDTKLTYLGFSYGTYLGQTYAHLFPTHVRALALDGVVDPSLSANDLVVTQAASFELNLQAFLADCTARKTSSPPCLYAQTGDPATKLNALINRLDASPLPVGSRLLTRALAMIGISYPLYDQGAWRYLDQGLTLADQGKGAILLVLSDLYFERNSNGTYTNANDANYAINCLDRPAPTDIAAYDRLGPAMAKVSPVFGPAFQYSDLACAYWPVKPTGHPGPLTADGAPPILLVGGTNDPATPYAWAQSVNQQLARSVLLTRQGNGHTSYDASACAHRAMDAYLIDLTLPPPGTVCT